MSNTPLFILLLVLNLPIIAMLGKLIFGSVGGFLECLGHCFRPDMLSAFQGQWVEDQWGTMKMMVFLGFSGFMLYIEYNWLLPVVTGG